MTSSTVRRFWSAYSDLPEPIKAAAQKQFCLWLENASHPSLRFKKTGLFWSVRVTDDFRALAYLKDGTYYWFWIGKHSEYEKILKSN